MKKSYKIVYGYKPEEYHGITKKELPIAFYAFLKETKFFGQDFAIDGKHIMRIEPNWNAVMGWNEGYRATSEDLSTIPRKLSKRVREYMIDSKTQAKQAIESGNVKLLELPHQE